MSTGEVAVNYLNSTNYMFLGGLIMAIAVEHCGLHNRVALKIIMMVRKKQIIECINKNPFLGGNQPSKTHAWLYVHHHVSLYVDLKHGYYSDDASNSRRSC